MAVEFVSSNLVVISPPRLFNTNDINIMFFEIPSKYLCTVAASPSTFNDSVRIKDLNHTDEQQEFAVKHAFFIVWHLLDDCCETCFTFSSLLDQFINSHSTLRLTR
ncbi:hypothetical protein C2R22_21415 (plasmid) [Salinigranum rubrum]|uniref:Uncharacterized protein n=1 Tax=Salinigranum rubrum TaxID=755307 RepID=A0A2I8VQE2_9EURY|nr:hypothetical protein C2R22_21415 [Salinigranum rubrum]